MRSKTSFLVILVALSLAAPIRWEILVIIMYWVVNLPTLLTISVVYATKLSLLILLCLSNQYFQPLNCTQNNTSCRVFFMLFLAAKMKNTSCWHWAKYMLAGLCRHFLHFTIPHLPMCRWKLPRLVHLHLWRHLWSLLMEMVSSTYIPVLVLNGCNCCLYTFN